MNKIPVHTRFSLGRSIAAAALGVLGAMTLPAWASDPQLQAQVAALQQTVNTQAGQIAALKSTVANQGTQITNQATQITNLQKSVIPLLTVVSFDPAHSLVQFRGVNVQIVNGTGSTSTIDPKATGNLIIGYNEDDGTTRGTCTVSFSNSDSFEDVCTQDGGTFTRSLSGSHNLVIGSGHGYSSFGGIVVGQENLITGKFAVVSGGIANTASGDFSSVSGGESNHVGGIFSSVSGGFGNTANSGHSSVSGGAGNTASGDSSSVSGGTTIVEGTLNGWASGGNTTPAFHSP